MYALPLPARYLKRNPHVSTPSANQFAVSYRQGFRISQPHPWRTRRREDPRWVEFYGERETDSNYFSGGCSNEYYSDKLLPELTGNLLYCEPSLNIIHRCVITRDGTGYRGRRHEREAQSEFIAATDQWFRPMNLRTGPHGELYIIDMYREIIEDYSAIPRFLQQQYGLDRGRTYGRLWRLVPQHASMIPVAPAALSSMSDVDLVHLLLEGTSWQRTTARRLLIERRSTSQLGRIRSLLPNTSGSQAIGLLYTLDGLDALALEDVLRGLKHADFKARVHALRLSERWLENNPRLYSAVRELSLDSDPTVLLQLALTLGSHESPDPTTLTELARKCDQVRWMEAAVLSSSTRTASQLLEKLLGKSEAVPASLYEGLGRTVVAEGHGANLPKLLSLLAVQPEVVQLACLRGFVEGAPAQHGELPEPTWQVIQQAFLKSTDVEMRTLALRLVGRFDGSESRLQKMYAMSAKLATDITAPLERRLQAIRLLQNAPFETWSLSARAVLLATQPVQLQLAFVDSLRLRSENVAAQVTIDRWRLLTPSVRVKAVAAMLTRTQHIDLLLGAIENGAIDPATLTTDHLDRLRAHPEANIAQRAEALIGARPAASQPILEAYLRRLRTPGSADLGRAVFKQHCQLCHRVRDQGYAVGPDLATIINQPDEAILTDILKPNIKIDPIYQTYVAITHDGKTVHGVLKSESATSLEFVRAEGQTETVLRRDLEALKAAAVSLMPSDLHLQLTPDDLANLLAYLRDSLTTQPSGDHD